MLRISDVKNVNKNKNCLTLVKLESKKEDKKHSPSRRDRAGKTPSSVQDLATSRLFMDVSSS